MGSSDAEFRCKTGWWYYEDGQYEKAAQLLCNGPVTLNAMWCAGELLIKGRGIARDVDRGIECWRKGAEGPDIGGTEPCALGLADLYERGKVVPRDYSKAYYYLGIGVAKCWDGDEESMRERPRLVSRQRHVGAKLTAAERKHQDERLREWIDALRCRGWSGIGELDSEVPWVSVFFDDPDGTAWYSALDAGKLTRAWDVLIPELGMSFRKLAIPESALIYVYNPSPDQRAKVNAALVNSSCKYANVTFKSCAE